jgi:mRNA-degrading endonuclease RelE of RelBE toxin-antitoxin system
MYFVELSERAQKFLNNLDKDVKERIKKRLKKS